MGSSGREAVLHGIPLFSGGTGFHNWSFRVKMHLDAMGVVHVVTQDPPDVAEEKVRFDEADRKAKALLVSFLGDECLEIVRDKATAKQMWRALENSFAKKSLATQNLIRKQLGRLRMNEGDSMRSHLGKFEDLIRQLRLAGAELAEADTVVTLFGTLPESYDPLITALENLGDDELSLDLVKQRLLGEELKQLDRHRNVQLEEKSTAFSGDKFQPKKVPKKFNGKCNRCGKKGHKKADCRVKMDGEANEASGTKSVSFMADRGKVNRKREGVLIFKLDSGSSDHLVNQKSVFSTSSSLRDPIIIKVAKDGENLEATETGTINGCSNTGVDIEMKKVLFIPELRDNLMSVKKLAKAGISVLFSGSKAVLMKGETTVATARLNGNLYELEIKISTSNSYLCQAELTELWHRRLGHLNEQSMKMLLNQGMVSGVPVKPGKLEFCKVCVQSKQCREPFSGTRPRANRPLERIHSDVCGPIDPPAWDGSRFMVSFIDDYTHFAVIYLMKRKSEVFAKLQEYEAMATVALGEKISKLTVDQGREYCSNEQKNWYKSKGIQLESTVAYSPQQNGVAERFNRTLIEKVRAMLLNSNMPKQMWSEAALAGVYLLNRSPTNALSNRVTPAELWLKQKPNLEKLRIFGCRAFCWIPNQQRKKLDSKSLEAIMIGYAPNGYRLWDRKKRKIFIARDVKFDESQFPFSNDDQEPKKTRMVVLPYEPEGESTDGSNKTGEDPNPVSQDDEVLSEAREMVESDSDESQDYSEANDDGEASALPPHLEHHELLEQASVRRSGRERSLPGKFLDYFVGYGAFSAGPLSFDVPERYSELVNRSDRAAWLKAVASELDSLKKNEVWKLTTCPADVKPLKSKWVFRLKEDEHGRPLRYKARLVAKGYLQKPGLDFEETYAPVARLATIRVVLAVGLHEKFHFHQMDVRTAFLHGKLEETIFMEVPEGVPSKPGQVCRLIKSLYGLKQSPRCWNIRFNETLLKLGFIRSKHDYCLYTRMTQGDEVVLILYVDDLLLGGRNISTVLKLKKQLAERFEMTDCGELRHFLGIKVLYDREAGLLRLSQTSSIDKLICRFGMEDCNPVRTPMEKGLVLDATEPRTTEPYREMLGSLMYTMLCVRPDICFPIGYLGRFQQAPTTQHWQALKRVVRYVKGTKDFELVYHRNQSASPLVGYVDSDWASDPVDRKSVTGYLFKVFGCSVVWCSKKQTTVATSSSEAEYVALSTAATEALWLQGILQDLKQNCIPTTIFEDNRGCIFMAKNIETKRSKHIDVRYHFVRDHVASGLLKIEALRTEDQLADIFTKALDVNRFKILNAAIGLQD